MSRYLILILINSPVIAAGLINALVAFKLKRIGRRRFLFRVVCWAGLLAGLIFAEPLYGFLFSHNLTQTEPLSLFDVMQITGIVFALFIANQAYSRVDLLEHRVRELHQELSIRLSRNEHDR